MMPRGRKPRPWHLIPLPTLLDIFDVRDQPCHVATSAYLRDMKESGVIHARYITTTQETVELWDVVVEGRLLRRTFDRAELPTFLAGYGLAMPLVEAV